MIILCDVDGVVADFIGALCKRFQAEGWIVTPETFEHFELTKSLTPNLVAMAEAWGKEPGFCSSLPWYQGGELFLRALNKLGTVFCVTAPWNAADWDSQRRAWLANHVPASRVISCSSSSKHLLHGDVLLEDNWETCERWLRHNPGKLAILIDRPWNRSALPVAGMVRVFTYAGALQQIAKLKLDDNIRAI